VTANQSNTGSIINQIRQDLNTQHMSAPHQRSMLSFFQEREGEPFQALMEEFMIGFQYLFQSERLALKNERD
jgi:hypothetical protein